MEGFHTEHYHGVKHFIMTGWRQIVKHIAQAEDYYMARNHEAECARLIRGNSHVFILNQKVLGVMLLGGTLSEEGMWR